MNNDLLQLAFDFDGFVGDSEAVASRRMNLGDRDSEKVVVVDFAASREKRAAEAEQRLYKQILDSIRHIA